MSELREAAQEALFWMQHARLHLTIKERLHPDGLIQYDNAARNLRAALAEPETAATKEDLRIYDAIAANYAHPPRDEWREASEPPEDDRSVLVWMPGKLGGLAIGRCSRGNWSPYYLGSPVTHWRDVQPPTEGER